MGSRVAEVPDGEPLGGPRDIVNAHLEASRIRLSTRGKAHVSGVFGRRVFPSRQLMEKNPRPSWASRPLFVDGFAQNRAYSAASAGISFWRDFASPLPRAQMPATFRLLRKRQFCAASCPPPFDFDRWAGKGPQKLNNGGLRRTDSTKRPNGPLGAPNKICGRLTAKQLSMLSFWT